MARGQSHNTDAKARNGNGAHLGFAAQMFPTAATLRKTLEPSNSPHVALGLIFLLPAQVSERGAPGWAA